MKKSRIILAMPSHSNFAEPIQQNLKHHEFEFEFVNSSPEHLQRIKLPFITSIYYYFRKFFLGDSSYKDKRKQYLKDKMITQNIQDKLMGNQFDYTLVIRPDLFSINHLNLLKKQTLQEFIGYQWNGLGRFPNTLLSIDLFNRFFVFDHTDLSNLDYKNYDLVGTTNFYFDMYIPQPKAHHGIVAYFVGLHFDERSKSIDICAQELIKNGITLDFNIRALRDKHNAQAQYQTQEINFIKKNIQFNENIEHINRADILVDVVNPVHNGLSFRTFEALYYQKKLITNNSTVQYYDFYHPNNILIWDGQNLDELKNFLASPLVKIDDQVIKKYSFNNWIENILNITPHEKIILPNIVE